MQIIVIEIFFIIKIALASILYVLFLATTLPIVVAVKINASELLLVNDSSNVYQYLTTFILFMRDHQ